MNTDIVLVRTLSAFEAWFKEREVYIEPWTCEIAAARYLGFPPKRSQLMVDRYVQSNANGSLNLNLN